MKKTIILLILLFTNNLIFAQSEFDKALNEISTDLADKLILKGTKRVVVLFVTDLNKAPTPAGTYVANIVSINIVNNANNFEVFDRENLNGIAEAKKLKDEGYIDVDKAKELGKLLSVEGIIIGNYTVLSNTMKLTLKALDANSGFVIAASMKDLPLNEDAGALLGINISSGSSNHNINNSNRGFNSPINSNEQINNPQTVSGECEDNNTGDYCFKNNTSVKLSVMIFGSRSENATLDHGQTQCFYNKYAGSWRYSYGEVSPTHDTKKKISGKGQILIEKCKSKTLSIN